MDLRLPTAQDVAALSERFATAGWAKQCGWRSDSTGAFFIEWSPAGREAMTRLRNVLKRWSPSLFDDAARSPGVWAQVWIGWRYHRITRKLRKSQTTRAEDYFIMAIAFSSGEETDGSVSPIYYSDLT